jgi:hypothetical protein
MTGRAIPEWIGKTPDTAVPERVQRRVFDAYAGRCYLSGAEIRAGDVWQIEHIKALCNGGENRESNLAPVLVEPHREKTRRDRAEKDKVESVRRKHLGIRDARRRIIPGSRLSPFKQRLGPRGAFTERRP